ncbi:unnamed protein product [Schistosoma curassoni]|uniref:Uncharacterized protein n=1 Tax=Schistosoma curassoni TaxID=6186 RepID=A0A183JIR0_9TREM|nr:unnamed protein product [Schistosoma curassoni]
MVCRDGSHIYDETFYKAEEHMLNESNHDKKSDAVLIDADFSDGLLLFNDILNKFEENSSEESNADVISNIICPHNALVS